MSIDFSQGRGKFRFMRLDAYEGILIMAQDNGKKDSDVLVPSMNVPFGDGAFPGNSVREQVIANLPMMVHNVDDGTGMNFDSPNEWVIGSDGMPTRR